MQMLLGIFTISAIAATTVLVCIPLYAMGVIRLILPVQGVRRLLAYPMDIVIDVWVSVFRWLIRTFRLLDIQVEMPTNVRCRNQWQAIVCNHQSWVDIVVLQISFRDVAPVLKFFTKRELIWVPFVGLAMWFLGFPYVYRVNHAGGGLSQTKRDTNTAVLKREGSRFLDKPVAVINFVEGTRFNPTKREAHGSPYENLLYPRRGGLQRTLVVLDDRVQTVLNSTIRYENFVPGFWDLLSGRATVARLIVEEIPKPSNDRESIAVWLDDIWAQKDRQFSDASS